MPRTEKDRIHRRRMAYLRGRLLEKRRELLSSVRRGIAEPRERVTSAVGDEYDAAADSIDTEMLYGVAQIEAASLGEVEHALRKLAEGTYGRCERCGGRIPAARLRAMPFASLCVKCKQREENKGLAADVAGERSWSRVETHSDDIRQLDHVIESLNRSD
jgi:DnaK suppressor protein